MKEGDVTQTIDEYIEACPEEVQPRLREIRKIILDAGPELTEKISWQMPTFYFKGNVIHFAAHKNHIGIYPGPDAIVHFSDRLVRYKTSKGAIQIPNGQALDAHLIRDIVRFGVERNKR